MKSRSKVFACLFGLFLYACGCSAGKDALEANETDAGSQIAQSYGNNEEKQTKESPEEKAVSPDYSFDEEFWMAEGDCAVIGDGVKFKVEALTYFAGDASYRIDYALTKGRDKYSGQVILEQNGEINFWPYEYNPYEITLTGAEGESDGKAGFRISDVRDVPEPMTVSGKRGDTYTTADYEYVVGEKCILYLDKDVTFRGDIMEVIECIMDCIENETGYKYYPDNEYSNTKTLGIQKLYYGFDPWPGVDGNYEKIAVYVVNQPDECISSWVCECAVVIPPFKFDLEAGGVYYLAAELTDAILKRNGEELNTKMSLGYKFCIGSRVAKQFTEYPLNDMALEQNYDEFPYPLNGSTAEEAFLMDYSIDFKTNQYGVYFVTYLLETYGNDGFHDFLERLNEKNADSETMPTDEMIAETLKEIFSDDVFWDFGEWYGKNSGRFTEEQ